ncbi:MAG TPA: hypothetical protein VLQ45_27460 [Thermoanaerobaculia bacterium]|nr:hypothetical protein [Thermoanaerobaculia bacterium]
MSLQEAKNHLEEAVAGGRVLITRDKGVSVRLEPVFEPGERIFGLDQGKFVVPEDFDAPMTLIEDLPSDPTLENKIRREAVLALCRLADSLPILDPRSPEEILSDEDSGLC